MTVAQENGIRPLILSAIEQAKASGLILTSGSCRLVCVANRLLAVPKLVEAFTAWRKDNQRPFLKLFDVTVEGTKIWARRVVEAPDRLLFVIEVAGLPIGHIGYADFGRGFEVCDVLRGETAPRTVMIEALNTMVCWLQQIGVGEIHLRVASDETRAIGLYHRVGFVATGLVPLERKEHVGEVAWVDSNDPSVRWDRFLIQMVLR